MLQQIVQWVMGHWQMLVTAILGIDAALIPLLPNVTLLEKIKDLLSSVAPKA